MSDPGGRVTVRIGNTKRTVHAERRPGVGRDRGARAKKHKVYVGYAGTGVIEAARGSAYVRVR